MELFSHSLMIDQWIAETQQKTWRATDVSGKEDLEVVSVFQQI
jgi:hypothetical protein